MQEKAATIGGIHDTRSITVTSNDGHQHQIPLRYAVVLQDMLGDCDMTHYEAVAIPFSSRAIDMFTRMRKGVAACGSDFTDAHEALNLFDFLHVAEDAKRFLDTWSIHSIKACSLEDFTPYAI